VFSVFLQQLKIHKLLQILNKVLQLELHLQLENQLLDNETQMKLTLVLEMETVWLHQNITFQQVNLFLVELLNDEEQLKKELRMVF
jgi:hypothetical protein